MPTLYARRLRPWGTTPAPVHVWRLSLVPGLDGALCGAEDPQWFIGAAKPTPGEQPCPDCLAALAAEALIEQGDAADLLAEWAP